ncbi:MAG TPA: SdrD B-like domain-containing protein, partial [Gaiellaceae bacterium]|nr:SdrD B-like domain-containing protein [Gaiellaceae bacterium]
PSGWSLQSIVCNDGASATPSSGNVSTKTATFKLDPGETVKCVFTDKKVPPPPCAIGDYVWKDLNKNGKQDDGTTSGINGVKLYLFDFSSWSIVASTTTANHPSTGKPGYYKFTVTCGKKYKIIVGIENFLKYKPLYGLFPTQPFQGGDPTKDSDGILIFTFPIVVNSGENLTIDFGYRVKEYWMYDYDHCYGW